MIKNIFFLITFTLSLGVFAQDRESIKNPDDLQKCGQFDVLEKMKSEDSSRYLIYEETRINLNQETEESYEKSGTIYTVPVVFHVLHNNGSENISDAQIKDALFILNRDFRKENTDVNSVYSTFIPLASDARIEFEFARITPDGNCFKGITRTVSSQTFNGDDGYEQVNAIVNGNNVYQGVWAHHKYLNIYVCEDLGNAAGYTYLPNGDDTESVEDMRYNSIFMRSDYVGSISSSTETRSRALTHEVGHWLIPSHIWGCGGIGEQCGDDFVPDTPITKGFSPCPSSSNSARVCDPSIVENYENYMDYSYCSKMFTIGQSTRMRASITGYVGGRNNIWTTSNLEEVGVISNPNLLCDATIESDNTLICQGNSINFSLTGVNDPITSYSWTFPGGTPNSSTQANPSVTYNTPGIYSASLSFTTATTSETITNTSFITVAGSTTGNLLPYFEGFQSSTFPPLEWRVENGGAAATWKKSNYGTSPTTGNSATLSFESGGMNTTGDIDDLYVPAISLNGHAEAMLTFDVAYRRYDDVFYDKLEVLISEACGLPYHVVYSKEGEALATEPDQPGYSAPSVWRNESIDLTPYAENDEVKIKFRGISGWGNQVYIDNINISTNMPNFTASSSDICPGETVTYTSTANGGSSWNWDFGTGATPSSATGEGPHTVTYNTSGYSAVSLVVDGVTTSPVQNIFVNQSPSVTLSNFPTLCVNYNAILLSQGNPNNGVYSGPGIDGNQFNPTTAGVGTHTITYTYTNLLTGCSTSKSKEIVVEGCAGLEDQIANSFKVFPNPTNGDLTISSALPINEVTVFDNAGRVVMNLKTENSESVHLDLSHLSKGVYIIQTKIDSFTKMNKIIVE